MFIAYMCFEYELQYEFSAWPTKPIFLPGATIPTDFAKEFFHNNNYFPSESLWLVPGTYEE